MVLAIGVVLAGCGDGDREDEHLPPDLVDQSQTTSVDVDDVASDRARQRVYQWVSGRNTILAQPDHYTTEASIGFAEGTEATVLCGGIQTANATVYVIDSVLMPPAS